MPYIGKLGITPPAKTRHPARIEALEKASLHFEMEAGRPDGNPIELFEPGRKS